MVCFGEVYSPDIGLVTRPKVRMGGDIDACFCVQSRVEIGILCCEHKTVLGDVEMVFASKGINGTFELRSFESVPQFRQLKLAIFLREFAKPDGVSVLCNVVIPLCVVSICWRVGQGYLRGGQTSTCKACLTCVVFLPSRDCRECRPALLCQIRRMQSRHH